MLLSDLLHHFPELTLVHDDPARLTIHRIDALHGASTPIDGTLYLHTDASEAARIVNGWREQYHLRGLA
ncbi:MAG: hypothetical protein H7311_13100, partial [Ramlibacter sp.]|nr:hypothetical protein [Cryobacterium sp.]